MPVSWEMASGPTVSYKMAGQGSICTVEGPKVPNFSNFRVQDVMSKGFSNTGEASKGSNHRPLSSNDAVVRGLSALSLCGQFEDDSTGEDRGSTLLDALHCGSPDLYRCMPSGNNEGSPSMAALPSLCNRPFGSGGLVSNADFAPLKGQILAATCENVNGDLSEMDTSHTMALRGVEGFENDCSHSVHDTSWSSKMPGSKNEEDVDLDLMSESSVSTENSIPAGSSSSVDAFQASDDTEAQSVYKEFADISCSLGASSSSRKGLSRFYAGKSRSFSCLRDVSSVKDLAKPESPYIKKRRVTSGSSGLPPLQKGPTGIYKKHLQNCKSTLALAVAMSMNEENEPPFSLLATAKCEQSSMQSRSYSLSDLQGASRSLFFIG